MKISNFFAFPFLTAGTLAVFVFIFFVYFYEFSEQYADEKSGLIAKAVVQNIQNEIQDRADTFNSFGVHDLILTEGREKKFNEFCDRFIRLFPDIFAINFVDSKGIIQRVYPAEKNKAALKKDLMKRADISPYLELAKNEKKAVLSHRLITYQGILGYALYVPIFNDYGLHVGFLNIVFNLDDWLRQYLKTNDWQNARIQIQWSQNPEVLFDEGPLQTKLNYENKFQVMNQEFIFRVGFVLSYLDLKRDWYRGVILIIGTLMVVFLYFLTFLRVKHERQLQLTNQNLETSHVLIGSLTHDITNPIFSLQLVVNKLFENHPSISEKDKTRTSQLFKSINELLETGKILQSLRTGKTRIPIEPVNVRNAFHEACAILEDRINQKQIKFDLTDVPIDLQVKAEHRSLVHHVINNVLTNSIKFSPQGGVIRVLYQESQNYKEIIIEDSGIGLEESQPKDKKLLSRDGTLGEKGYGFGLMQVMYFMHYFKGEFKIENKKTEPGARVTLQFPKA